MISYQGNRNRFLQEEIKKAEAKIEEIKALDEQKAALVKRMEAIQGLEEIRPLVVHLFDELVRKVPDGVYFTNLKQVGGKVTLSGVAQSDARVSSLMTNLESSEWLKFPKIMVIQKEELKSGKNEKMKRSVSKFQLEINQLLPKSAEPEKVEPKAPPAPPKPPEKK
jgi:type IV pilus assembly protein PilN